VTSADPDADPVQDRIHRLEDAHQTAVELLDRSLRLARRLTAGFPHRPLPPLADQAVRLAVVFHYRAERAERDLDDFINHLERQGR
jgi:hypothetical protein